MLWVWVMRLLDVGYYCRWLGKGGGWREAEQHDVVTSRTHCSFSLSHTLSHFLLTHTHTHTLSHSLTLSLHCTHSHTHPCRLSLATSSTHSALFATDRPSAGGSTTPLPNSAPTSQQQQRQQHPPTGTGTNTNSDKSRTEQSKANRSRAEQISAVVSSLRALLLRPGRNAGHSFPSPFCALTIYQHAHPRLATITPCRLYLCAECHSNCSTRQTRSPAPTEPQWRDNRNSRAVRRHQFRPSTWSRRRYHTGQRRRLLAVDLVAMDCQQWLWIYSGDYPARGGCHGQTAQS